MEYQAKNQTIGVADRAAEITAEQSFEADLHLPEYCPEIARILRCAADTAVNSVQQQGEQATVNGTVTVRLLYVGENGEPAAYEQSYPVQSRIAVPADRQGEIIAVRMQTAYANCRALDPRRAEVKAMLTVSARTRGCRKESFLSGVDGGGMQIRTETGAAADLIGLAEKVFALSEVAELPADRAPIARVLHISASVLCSEVKIIPNKALIKGDCEVTVHYLAEGGVFEAFTHHLPVSQILELDGLTEDCLLQLQCAVRAAEAAVKADAAGEMKLLELSVSVQAVAAAYKDTTLTFVTDAYSTAGAADVQRRTAEISVPDQQFQLSFTNQVVLESIGVAVRRVIAVWCDSLTAAASLQDGGCCLSGTYQAGILYEDAEGQLGFLQKSVAFDDRFPLKTQAERISVDADLQLLGVSCVLTGDSRLELHTEIAANGLVFALKQRAFISSLALQPAAQDAQERAALTLYYSEPGESLWEIARRYRTTVEAICAENHLEEERIAQKTMLLIPAVND